MRHSHSGVTLVELITVLLILSILSASALTQWNGTGITLASHAGQLAGDIRYLQGLAMTHGQRLRINFLATGYSFTNAAGTVTYPHPVTGTNIFVLDSGITLSATPSSLVFNGDGVPYVNDLIPGTSLTTDALLTFTQAGTTKRVRVKPETGRTTVE